MFCFVSKKKLNDPYVRCHVDPACGDTPDDFIWTNEVRIDTWNRVKHRDKFGVWKHMKSLYAPAGRGPCVITGCGPSLLEMKRQPSCPSFAINRSALHYAPDYWTFVDEDAYVTTMASSTQEKRSALLKSIVCSIQMYDTLQGIPATLVEYTLDPTRWNDPKERPLYWNETTLGWVIHLAIRMGFDTIYFVGTELTTDPHFDKSIGKCGDRIWQMVQLQGVCDRMLYMFSDAERPKWLERDIKFLDASNGNLPVPKCRVEDIP